MASNYRLHPRGDHPVLRDDGGGGDDLQLVDRRDLPHPRRGHPASAAPHLTDQGVRENADAGGVGCTRASSVAGGGHHRERIVSHHRMGDAPTILLDEVDNARMDEAQELRALLNSGHSRASAWVIRRR